MLIHEMTLYQVMGGVWRAKRATKVTGLFFSETKNSQKCVTEHLAPFLNIFPITKKIHDFF